MYSPAMTRYYLHQAMISLTGMERYLNYNLDGFPKTFKQSDRVREMFADLELILEEELKNYKE